MKLKFLPIALLFCATMTAKAQNVGINTDASTPDNSAMLDVKSTDKGMLIPRMTEAQKNLIASPAIGLLIYQTDGTSGFYFYQGTPSNWVLLGAKGDTGAQGPAGTNGTNGTNGTSILQGTNAPGTSTGADNDTYINTANGDVYKKTSGTWSATGNIKGPQGAQGNPGTAGTNGTNGTNILQGTNAPGTSTGADNDTYINTANGDVYKKTSGTWSATGNIKGPQGAQGAQGNTGPAGATGQGFANGSAGGQIIVTSGSAPYSPQAPQSVSGDVTVTSAAAINLKTTSSTTGDNVVSAMNVAGGTNRITASRLGSGTTSSSTYLKGDGTWGAVTVTATSGAEVIATLNTAQTINASATADVQFNSNAITPSFGAFNTSTYSYTVGTSGNYLISTSIAGTGNALAFPMIYVNGTSTDFGVSYNNPNATTYQSRGSLTTVRKLTAGDVVKIVLQNANGATTAVTLPANGPSTFAITKL